jgi:iron complex transport system permease protein
MGDLSFAKHVTPALILLVLTTGFCYLLARPMNLLAQGDNDAALLGLDVSKSRRIIFVIAAVLTATAVMLGGTIGFVGLIVPHLLRLWKTGDHRWLVPASVLGGGSLLVLADTAARTLLAPQQLPVGALMALIGVPLFLILIRKQGLD